MNSTQRFIEYCKEVGIKPVDNPLSKSHATLIAVKQAWDEQQLRIDGLESRIVNFNQALERLTID
jgi:hypothetical protein